MRKKKLPLVENVEIIDAGSKGTAIGKTADGLTLMVKNAVPGDVADIQIYRKKKRYAEGNVVQYKKYSEKRTNPVCEHFGVCGGCKWQNLQYDWQLFYKDKEVENNLQRIGGVTDAEKLDVLGSEDIYFYRNKMEFSFSNRRWLTPEEIQSGADFDDRNALGFHIPGMWSKILDINKCWLQPDPSNDIRNAIKGFATENGLTFYDPVNPGGMLRSLMIRTSLSGDVMVLIQFFEDDETKRIALLKFLKESFPQISSLLYAINTKGNDSVYDLDIELYHGMPYITELLDGLKFRIGAKSFYQTNPKQAEVLYGVVKDFADLQGDEVVYDLYTGTGTIAQYIARHCQRVLGVESVAEAVKAAKSSALHNGIQNTDFVCGDMREVFTAEFVATHGRPDVIITDPPRDGMHPKVVEQILQVAPKKVVYVSCNSATQARDIALMHEKYKVVKYRAVDMFPHTHHIESVALLERK
ncbi:MAG: 23S rRNA (uracil(1939)-C(5))-methyltransferase RlmD [Weeksellaceae bacterium]|nr:23S rRNA (uracil(1939)-C(5))-methyltransferase RlmD [Weeksellaceae bacterium]